MPLKVSDGIAAWIDDFKKSDAPQFKGKDAKERRDMALAAYLSAKRGDQNESTMTTEGKMKNIASKIDDIAASMKKDKMLKPFVGKFVSLAKKTLNIKKSLETVLPDYVSGAKINSLVSEGKAEDRAELKKAMAAFLAKGGKIKKLPPGKAQGYHGKDDPGKDMYGMMGEPDTRAIGTRKKVKSMESVEEAKRVVHSNRPDSLKSLRVMHPKPAGEKPPFDGPYRKAGEVRKDKYGNVIKNLPRHLARKAAKSVGNGNVGEISMTSPKGIPNLKIPRKKTPYEKEKAIPKKESKSVNEETNFQVNIEGLPMMFMSGMGQGEIMQKLRKIVKQPSMIQSVKRVTDADVKKTFRLKAQGRDEEEQVDEAKLAVNESVNTTHVVIDTADDNKVVATASSEKGAKSSIVTAELPPMSIKNKKTLKIVQLKKPISSRKSNMMISRPFSESKLDELSPETMNSYKRKAADDLYKSHSRYSSILSKPKTKKDREALDKRVAKRKAGLDLVTKRSGTAGYQDEKK